MAITAATFRLLGHYEHSLDDKGRVIVPLKFREALGEEFILTTGPDNHLRVYPMPIWEQIAEQLFSTDVDDEHDENLNFLRRLYGNCEFVGTDQQNRLSIPRFMRDWAKLREGDTAVILGSVTRLEIWSRTLWEEYNKMFTAVNASRASAERKFREGPRPTPTASSASSEPPVAVVETRGNDVPTSS